MNTFQRVLKKQNVKFAEAFKNDVQNIATHYLFIANSNPTTPIQVPSDSPGNDVDVYDSMLFGNRIKPENVSLMTRKYEWTANTVYDKYDPNDPMLSDKQFYVMTVDDTDYNVYKCLDNNRNAKSTVQPFGKSSDIIYSVQDGYVWKYLYTITDYTYRSFATIDYIPVDTDQSNNTPTNPSGIEVIPVEYGGFGYSNYTIGTFEDINSIRVGRLENRYKLNSSASNRNNFYNGCLMKVTDANTNLSDYKLIVDYIGSSKIVILEGGFDPTLDLRGSYTYEIFPGVAIQNLSGTGTSDTCLARAIISANSGNSISSIEVINPGSNYRKVSATVAADPSVGVTSNCIINPIVSPPMGHGANLAEELYAYRTCITTTFIGNTGVLLSDNGYGTIGLLKQPSFANVAVTLDPNTLIGSFLPDENIYRYRSYTLTGNASIQIGNSTLVSDDSSFGTSIRNGDQLIITNGFQNFYANVDIVISPYAVKLVTSDEHSPSFTDANCKVSVVQTVPFGKVSKYALNTILNLTNVIPNQFDSYTNQLVGEMSNCTASIDSALPSYITISGRNAYNFDQFNQVSKFVGTLDSGEFIDNELILQGTQLTSSTPSAVYFASNNVPGVDSDVLYATKLYNSFNPGLLTGMDSGATFTYQYKYDGDLIKDSGDILYLENLNYITRDPNQSETIKIILEF